MRDRNLTITRSALARYTVAIVAVALAASLRIALKPFWGETFVPFIFFYPAILLAAWYGRLGPGIVAIVLSGLIAGRLFVDLGEGPKAPGGLLALLVFLVATISIVVAIEAMHRARARAVAELAERKRSEEALRSDITHRKGAEQALRESETRKSAILESSLDAIIAMDQEGRIVDFNPAAEALFKYPRSEVLGKPVADTIIPERFREAHWRGLRRFLEMGEGAVLGRRIEMPALRADGSEFESELAISASRLENGQAFFTAYLRDITERKQTEAVVRETQQKLALHAAHLEATVAERTAKLRESINELQTLSYSIAHDMRAPLRAMSTFAHLLLEEATEKNLSAESQDYCRRMLTAASRLDKLINDALNYTKVALEELPLERVDLVLLLRGLIDTYPNLQDAEIHLADNLPSVLGNEALLTQCFSNLLGNAVKFVAPGVRPHVEVWAETSQNRARISVQDNGIGIPQNSQARLFGIFQKLDRNYEGTGIGLAIVRKVVERMGGSIGVESELGRGSRFWVELPLARVDVHEAQP